MSVSWRVSIPRSLRRLPSAVERAAVETLEQVAREAARVAPRIAPVDTGALRASIYYDTARHSGRERARVAAMRCLETAKREYIARWAARGSRLGIRVRGRRYNRPHTTPEEVPGFGVPYDIRDRFHARVVAGMHYARWQEFPTRRGGGWYFMRRGVADAMSRAGRIWRDALRRNGA